MWGIGADARVFLCLGATDMRRAINGLSIMVEQELEADLAQGDLFVFCNRSKTIVKILYWAGNGFCLWQKNLESNRFKWPMKEEDLMRIDQMALEWLLEGLDIEQAHEKLLPPTMV